MTPATATVTTTAAAYVAAYGLPGTRREAPAEPLPDLDWKALVRRVEHERIPGLLLLAIEDRRFPATPRQWDEIARHHLQSMRSALTLERLLLDVVAAFEAAGVDYRVLKGSAYAHLDYPDPALRSFGDIDLLVPTSQYDEAVAALGSVGAWRRVPELRPGFDRRFGKGGSFITPTGLEIDLHRLFTSGPIGLATNPDDLFTDHASFVVGDRQLLALSREPRFLHACFHAVLGSPSATPRLASLRDVAQMLLHPALDSERVKAVCAAWQAQAVVSAAIRATWETLELADILPLTVWASGYEPDRHAQANLRLYEPGVPFAAQAAAGVSVIRGLRPKAAYVRALALPGRPYRLRALRALRRLVVKSRRARRPRGGA